MSIALDVIERMTHEVAASANKTAALVGPDWNKFGFGLAAGIRLRVLSDIKRQIMDAEIRELEANAPKG